MHAIVIGGTGFVGRPTVTELLDHGYHVTIVTRGNRENPFADEPTVTHVRGSRNDREVLVRAREETTPDVVIDCISFVPQQVAMALDVFADVDAYVFVSSTGAYARRDLPRREGVTPLEEFTSEHAVDDLETMDIFDFAAYGPRKAECDRVCFAAAEDGANAIVARPTFVYGPGDHTERMDYWIDRAANHDRVLVPGDGDTLAHQVYVEDVASALVILAERGTPGEAYNVGARQVQTLDDRLETIAGALGTDVELVHAGDRVLAEHGLDFGDFPLVSLGHSLISTAKLAALGWDSTPHAEAFARTVAEHRESDRAGRHHGPDRSLEERAIEELSTTPGTSPSVGDE